MPVYEYVCTECGSMTEVTAKISEYEKGLKVTCPNCGSTKMARVFSSFAVGGSRGSFNPGSMSGCSPMAGPGCC